MALRTIASTPATCSRPSMLGARSICASSTCRPRSLAAPATAAAVFPVSTRALATTAFAPARDCKVADHAFINRHKQKWAVCAAASAPFEGTDDSELMSAPADLPREQAEVFFSEDKLHQEQDAAPGSGMDSSTGRGSEGQPQQGEQAAERSAGGSHEPEGGRFDEEALPGDKPYSPSPKERGHGISPHKDQTNTGPGQMSSPAEGSGSSQQLPSGDEQNPAAAI